MFSRLWASKLASKKIASAGLQAERGAIDVPNVKQSFNSNMATIYRDPTQHWGLIYNFISIGGVISSDFNVFLLLRAWSAARGWRPCCRADRKGSHVTHGRIISTLLSLFVFFGKYLRPFQWIFYLRKGMFNKLPKTSKLNWNLI